MLFYLRAEEERQTKLREEEEARKLEETERKTKEEAERRAKLDEFAKKQRRIEQELEEKERIRKEALLGRSTEGSARSSDLPSRVHQAEPETAAPAAAAAPAPSPGKHVPRFRRAENASAKPDRWGSSRHDDRPSQPPDSWCSGDDRRPSSFGGGKVLGFV